MHHSSSGECMNECVSFSCAYNISNTMSLILFISNNYRESDRYCVPIDLFPVFLGNSSVNCKWKPFVAPIYSVAWIFFIFMYIIIDTLNNEIYIE